MQTRLKEHVHMSISTEIENRTDFLQLKACPYQQEQRSFSIWKSLQSSILPAITFSFNTLSRQTLTASRRKRVSDSIMGDFFIRKLLFIWKYMTEMVPRMTQMLISLACNRCYVFIKPHRFSLLSGTNHF